MAENRWLIIVGGLVLILMLLIGTFSLGVYIGRYGTSLQGMLIQPVQQGQPPPGGPFAGLQAFPGGDPDVIGLVRTGSRKGIELATNNGPRLIEVNQITRITDTQRKQLQLSDLRPGDIVAVFGDLIADDGERLQATLIIRLPPRQE